MKLDNHSEKLQDFNKLFFLNDSKQIEKHTGFFMKVANNLH